MQINWFQVLVRGVQMLVFGTVIAAFTTLLLQGEYLQHLLFVVCIVELFWLTMELGRLLVPAKHCLPDAKGGDRGWPKGLYHLALTVASILVGFFGGFPLAARLLVGQFLLPPTPIALLLYLFLAVSFCGMASFFVYTRNARVAAETAERDAAQARRTLLQSQLEPHMLFNTLANLDALIETDPAAARHMLNRMEGFLRTSLSASRAIMHPLADEFERLHDYLALMAIRMGPRLTWDLHLPDELRAQPVPPLLLQPLVENAIKHGLEPRVKGGRIKVSATCADQQLVLAVRDTGVGFNADQPMAEGRFGLTQVIERVASACGDQGRVKMRSRPGKGTTVRIILPLQPDMPCPPP